MQVRKCDGCGCQDVGIDRLGDKRWSEVRVSGLSRWMDAEYDFCGDCGSVFEAMLRGMLYKLEGGDKG